ncbi:MAG: dihydrodipicolinate synthase family protein [Ignavibacterium sp.]
MKQGPNLTGVFPPLITPFTVDGEIDRAAYRANLRRWKDRQMAGWLVAGSNSEAVFLSYEEKLHLIELAAEQADGRTIIAGTGQESARETIRFTNDAARAGAQAALVLTPFYYRDQMTGEALIAFFTEVAEASKIPILIYNVPKFTSLNVELEVLERLSRHPNIIGIKDSKGDAEQLRRFRNGLDRSFQILAGTASVWFPALAMGIKGGFLALANCCADECAQVQAFWDEGRHEEALALHNKLLPVNHVVTVAYGVPGLKYACGLRGLDPGHLRNPLQPLGDSQKKEIQEVMRRAGLIS